MDNIKQYIQEKLVINKNIKYSSQESDKQLEKIAYGMFNKYLSSYTYNELKNWIENGLEPDDSDYKEFIDDIIEYSKEENININRELKFNLDNFEDLDKEEQEEIKLQILRGMEKHYNDIF